MAKKTQTSTQVDTTELPAWAQQYYSDVLGRGLGALNEPYQTYEGARIAPFAEEQLQSFDLAKAGLGGWQPYNQQATQYIGGAVAPGAGGLAAAQKYFDVAANERAMSSVSPYLREGVSGQSVSAALPYLTRAGSMSAAGAAQPYINESTSREAMDLASPYLQAAASGSALSAANPYLRAGRRACIEGNTFPIA